MVENPQRIHARHRLHIYIVVDIDINITDVLCVECTIIYLLLSLIVNASALIRLPARIIALRRSRFCVFRQACLSSEQREKIEKSPRRDGNDEIRIAGSQTFRFVCPCMHRPLSAYAPALLLFALGPFLRF